MGHWLNNVECLYSTFVSLFPLTTWPLLLHSNSALSSVSEWRKCSDCVNHVHSIDIFGLKKNLDDKIIVINCLHTREKKILFLHGHFGEWKFCDWIESVFLSIQKHNFVYGIFKRTWNRWIMIKVVQCSVNLKIYYMERNVAHQNCRYVSRCIDIVKSERFNSICWSCGILFNRRSRHSHCNDSERHFYICLIEIKISNYKTSITDGAFH